VAVLAAWATLGCTRSGDLLTSSSLALDAAVPDAPALDVAVPTTALLYLSPTGADTNPGTEAAPWRTFARALPVLGPGQTLVLLDGTYDGMTTGYLQAFCGTNAQNGTPALPITVRAQHERRAFLQGDGSGAAVELSGCANWIVEGIYAAGADVAGEMGDEPGSVFVLTHGCSNVVLRHVVGARPNHFLTASVFVVAHSAANVLIEESEALDFHYYGFHAYDSLGMVFRRDYANSRNGADIVGGAPTMNPTTGDGGFWVGKSRGAIIENCIAENVADGFLVAASRNDMGGRIQPAHDLVLGCIASQVTRGFVLDSRCNGTRPCNRGDQIVSDPLLSNDVAVGSAQGFASQGVVAGVIENATSINASDTGLALLLEAENVGLTSSAIARQSLAVTGAGVGAAVPPFGFHAAGQASWQFARCNSFGAMTAFAPMDGHVMAGGVLDPMLGGCLVYVPSGSPMKGQGGAPDIGANVVYRYQGGVLTGEKLWDQTSGAFPCGAVIPGLSDAANIDASCVGVGARLHVGAGGCAVP
jgi:hypothetical protein